MKFFQRLTMIAVSGFLLACGGGGGGGGSSSPLIPPASAAAPFSQTNFPTAAGTTAATILAAATSESVRDSIASAPAVNRLPNTPNGLVRWAISQRGSQRESAQAVQSFSESCVSGSLSGSFNDANNDGDLSGGDSATFNFNNCVLQSGDPAVNGSFTMQVATAQYNSSDEIAAFSITINYSNFVSYGITLNGAATVNLNSSGLSTTYTNFASVRAGGTLSILNYTAVINNSQQMSINGLITFGNNTYTLSTPALISLGSTYPIAGYLRVTDAAGGRIDITSFLLKTVPTVDCDLYLPGDNTRDNRITSAWSAL